MFLNICISKNHVMHLKTIICCLFIFIFPGVMRLDSLEFLFKSQTIQPENIKVYITNLLSKFEVALQFDDMHLLLPSLLPTEIELQGMARKKSDVRVSIVHREKKIIGK